MIQLGSHVAARPPVAPVTSGSELRVQGPDRLGGVVREYVQAA
jgi:hypothetical protein